MTDDRLTNLLMLDHNQGFDDPEDRLENAMPLRLPNKTWWIEPLQRLKLAFGQSLHADCVHGMNSGHFFVFIRSYMKNRLMRLVFDRIEACRSQTIHCTRKSARIVARVTNGACMITYYLSLRQVCIPLSIDIGKPPEVVFDDV